MAESPPDPGRSWSPLPVSARGTEFAALFRGSARVLWLIAVGIVRDRALADDVVQEAALVALRKFDQFRLGTNFTAWMAQTVRYVAYNEARREKRRVTVSLDGSEESDVPTAVDPPAQGRAGWTLANGAGSATDLSDFAEHVRIALADVSEMARTCLLLRTIEQLEYAEISRLVGIPEGTAMSHVHRTRKFLRERLAGFEVEERLGAE